MTNPSRLHGFVRAFTRLVDAAALDEAQDEARLLDAGKALLADLVGHDDWLPAAFAQPHPDRYQQYLLYCDPQQRFSVVSFVWGPGQSTPVHDHTVWGMVGVLRGAEQCEEFAPPAGAAPLTRLGAHYLPAGAIDIVSPRVGDIHRVSNASAGAVSVSIHVYGADIGRIARHVYDPATGAASRFVSGYTNIATPEAG